MKLILLYYKYNNNLFKYKYQLSRFNNSKILMNNNIISMYKDTDAIM